MIRPIPEAYELGMGGADDFAITWLMNSRMDRFASTRGPCRLTRLEKLVSLAYFRNLDLSVLDGEGDYL